MRKIVGLFKINKKVTAFGIELKEITVNDENIFLEYLMQSDYTRVSYYNSFYYMCALNLNEKRTSTFMYAIVDDWLLTFEYMDKYGFAIKNSPINKNGDYSDMNHIYKLYIAMISHLNSNINVGINKCYNVLINDVDTILDKTQLKNVQNNYKEFIFLCNDLIELKGKEYKSRRRMVNKVKTDNPDFFVREYAESDKESIIKIYNSWTEEYTDRLNGEQICNVGLTKNTFDILVTKSNNYRIFVGVIDGNIEGFIVIVPLCKDTKCVLIEYTNLEIKGLAETLWYEGLKLTTDLGVYENDGTGGEETDGLFFYKNSHRPVNFVCTYEFDLNTMGKKISKLIFKNLGV